MKMGLLGEKLPYTLSPVVHEKILKAIGRQGEYGVFEITAGELPEFFQKAKNENYLGVNVTIPHKTNVLKFLDALSPEAERIGAVNTVHIQDGRLIGYNTDYFGFGYALKKARIDPKGRKACVMGAGGAAKAVAVSLKDAGADVVIISRDPEKIKHGFMGFNVQGYSKLEGDILVNTTPLGTWPDVKSSPVGKDTVACFRAAMDIIYNPRKTLFLRYAEGLSMPCADGLTMLVAQAVKAQEIWQGIHIKEDLIDIITEEL